MDQLSGLRMFVRIAEAGAFSKAADSMDVPRATATKLVQDLERHLGVQLLFRTTRKVSVTPEGAAYYERASKLLIELDELDESVGIAGVKPQGRLRVDIGSSLANMLLIPALPDFRQRYPAIQLDLGVNDRPINLVGEGVDCVIRGGELLDTTLVARRLADLEWVTCASPRYLDRNGRPRSPKDLLDQEEGRGHALVGYFSSLSGRHAPLEFQRGAERMTVPVGAAVAVNESTAHLSALQAGLGVGQTFRFMAKPSLEDGTLTELLTGWKRPHTRINIVYPGARHLQAKVRVFTEWAAALFAQIDSR